MLWKVFLLEEGEDVSAAEMRAQGCGERNAAEPTLSPCPRAGLSDSPAPTPSPGASAAAPGLAVPALVEKTESESGSGGGKQPYRARSLPACLQRDPRKEGQLLALGSPALRCSPGTSPLCLQSFLPQSRAEQPAWAARRWPEVTTGPQTTVLTQPPLWMRGGERSPGSQWVGPVGCISSWGAGAGSGCCLNRGLPLRAPGRASRGCPREAQGMGVGGGK